MSPFSLLFSAALFATSFAIPQGSTTGSSTVNASSAVSTSTPSLFPDCIVKCGQLINVSEQEMAAALQNGKTCENLQKNQDNTAKYVNCLQATCDQNTFSAVEGTLASCGVQLPSTGATASSAPTSSSTAASSESASSTTSTESATPTTDSQKKSSSASSLKFPSVLVVGMFVLFMI